ncbi:hypothetical protein GW750_09210 [bacterium]|nr:hypothetical protein [bacterium]
MRIQAFGSKLSPDAYLADILMDEEELLALHQQRIDRLASVPQYTKPVDLN